MPVYLLHRIYLLKAKAMGNVVVDILSEKCPSCRKGKIFHPKKRLLLDDPKMKQRCDVCGYYFDREPGYFIGSMYVSYGLAVFQGLITFLICHYVFHLQVGWLIGCVSAIIILFSIRNFRLARTIWIYIFP